MPYPYSISSTDTIPIPEAYYHHHHYHHHQKHQKHPQADSLISQDPHAITFSTASPTILPMTDHTQHTDLNIRDLHSRLARVEQEQHQHQHQPQPHPPHPPTRGTHDAQRGSRPSLDSTLMPRFTKSSTMSTTDTSSSFASSSLHAPPSCTLHPETVGLEPGTFSKPRVPPRSRRQARSRRDTVRRRSSSSSSASSTKSNEEQRAATQQQQFKYYGRHGNQWLFNDFSVTDAVARGFKRVFSSGGERKGGDWYEDRRE